jgi:hypothetical protein
MRWHDFFRVIFGFCVLILCVGLVGCRFSEPGSVDELRLLEVSQVTGDRDQGAGPVEARDALLAREDLESFPLESVIYVDVGGAGDRGQVTGNRDQGSGDRKQVTGNRKRLCCTNRS